MKIGRHRFVPPLSVVSGMGSAEPLRRRQIQDHRNIGAIAVTYDLPTQRFDKIQGNTVAVALVCQGRIKEPVADNPSPSGERRLDDSADVVLPGGVVKQNLG